MRKPARQHLDAARREAPGPWRIGSEDDEGIHVLDANGEPVVTLLKSPPRSDQALGAIQALLVRVGDEMLAPRLCANPDCRRLFDARSRTQRHCSTACSLATQPRVIEARTRDAQAHELRAQGLTWREVAERSGHRDGKHARLGASKHARRLAKAPDRDRPPRPKLP